MAKGTKTGGRKEGTPNKLNNKLMKTKMVQSEIDPEDVLIDVLKGKPIIINGEEHYPTANMIVKIASELMPYRKPKLSSIDMRADVTMSHEQMLDDLE